jgi:Holliday junction resolvase RusA-like endonuclease
MIEPISFFVPGIPAPGGSKRFVGFGKNTKRAIIVDAGGERTKHWRATVAQMSVGAMMGKPRCTGPLRVSLTFYVPRPKGHFRKNGTLHPRAPEFPMTKPDALKLARSTEDAMTGIVYADDAQAVTLLAMKRYSDDDIPAGCRIRISTATLSPPTPSQSELTLQSSPD